MGYEVGAKGSGPNGSKVVLVTQSMYGGMDWGSNCGRKELRTIIISIELLVEKVIGNIRA